KGTWEAKIQTKENDVKSFKTRLAWRDKRLQEEIGHRDKELKGLRKTVEDELHKVRVRYEAERKRLEDALKERQSALSTLQAQQGKQRQNQSQVDAFAKQSLQEHRQHLEDSIRQLVAQYEGLKKQFEPILMVKEAELSQMNEDLAVKEAQ